VPGEGDIKGEEAFFVVLDGHGGTKVMEFCEQNLQEVKEKPYQAYLKFL
jgi:serine/threonine protein phosphatase PrpC